MISLSICFFCLFCKMHNAFNNCYPCPITDSGISGGSFYSHAVRIKVLGFGYVYLNVGIFCCMLFYGHVARTLRFWIQKRAHELCMAVSKPLKSFASLFRWCWSAGCGSAQLHTIAQVLTSHGGVGACRLPILFQISFCFFLYSSSYLSADKWVHVCTCVLEIERGREETAKTTLQILMCNTSGVWMATFIQVSTLDTQTSCIFVRLWTALAVILLAKKKKNGPTLDVTISRKEAAKEVVLSIYTPNSY